LIIYKDMLTVTQNIIDVVKADATIKTFINERIYPEGVDIIPETTLFPLITIHNISEITLTNPKGERECLVQLSIWSRLSQLETEQIAERLLTILNFQTFNSGYGTTIKRWQREDSGVDLPETDRRIWHKALTFRVWAKG